MRGSIVGASIRLSPLLPPLLLLLLLLGSTCRTAHAFQAVQPPSSSSSWRPSPNLLPTPFDIRKSAIARTTTTSASALRMSSSGGNNPLTKIRLGENRRPLLSEDDVAAPPDRRVVDAVESAARGGGTVVPSDVAAKAGVSLSLARKSLSTLATLTGGDIAVSPDGELLYSFPKDVRGAMASNSARYRAVRTLEQIWPKLFYGIRVAFGVVLFVSIFAIFSTIFVVLQGGGSSDRDRDDRRRGGGMGGGYGMGNFMLDLFFPRWGFYSPYYGYYGRVPYSARYYGGRVLEAEDEEEDPNIFERIFSYIFGDGNPNFGIENARLRAAAQVIRDNGGAVVAEQLAPFVDAPMPDRSYMDDDDTAYVDESYVLPIVSQLGGEPVVTKDGDIAYVFPELQLSAENTLEAAGLGADASPGEIVQFLKMRGADTRTAVEKSDLIKILEMELSLPTQDPTEPLQEEELEFSRSGTGWNVLAGVLGAVNLGGALYLGEILSSPAMYGVQLPSYFGLVQSAYPLLLAYAVLYNVIPAVRNVYNKGVNEKIKERNAARRSWSTVLRSMGGKVQRKLRAAKGLRTDMRRLGRGDSVFDTRQDVKELELQKESDELAKFDRLLQDDDNAFQ